MPKINRKCDVCGEGLRREDDFLVCEKYLAGEDEHTSYSLEKEFGFCSTHNHRVAVALVRGADDNNIGACEECAKEQDAEIRIWAD